MDINLNPQVGSVGKIATGPVKPRDATPAADDVVLDESRALEARFSDAPEVRPDVVARARALVADPQYPPAETIRKIANLLAINFDSAE